MRASRVSLSCDNIVEPLIEPGDLQFYVILIGPKPRGGMIFFFSAEHIFRHHLGLIDGIGHAFQANAPAFVGETRTIAGSPNSGL